MDNLEIFGWIEKVPWNQKLQWVHWNETKWTKLNEIKRNKIKPKRSLEIQYYKFKQNDRAFIRFSCYSFWMIFF